MRKDITRKDSYLSLSDLKILYRTRIKKKRTLLRLQNNPLPICLSKECLNRFSSLIDIFKCWFWCPEHAFSTFLLAYSFHNIFRAQLRFFSSQEFKFFKTRFGDLISSQSCTATACLFVWSLFLDNKPLEGRECVLFIICGEWMDG